VGKSVRQNPTLVDAYRRLKSDETMEEHYRGFFLRDGQKEQTQKNRPGERTMRLFRARNVERSSCIIKAPLFDADGASISRVHPDIYRRRVEKRSPIGMPIIRA
jgi:hypothetical protein